MHRFIVRRDVVVGSPVDASVLSKLAGRPFCDDRYCARRGAEGDVGLAKGEGVAVGGPGSGAGAGVAVERDADGAGAGAPDCTSSGTGAGAAPDAGSAGVGNAGRPASSIAGEGADVEAGAAGRARSSTTRGGCAA